MDSPDLTARSMVELNLVALSGVVSMVTTTLRCANILAISKIGIRWPCDIKGINTKWSWGDCEAIAIWIFGETAHDESQVLKFWFIWRALLSPIRSVCLILSR